MTWVHWVCVVYVLVCQAFVCAYADEDKDFHALEKFLAWILLLAGAVILAPTGVLTGAWVRWKASRAK